MKWTFGKANKDLKCPECGSAKTVKQGTVTTRKGKKPRRKCQECGRTFYARKTGGK